MQHLSHDLCLSFILFFMVSTINANSTHYENFKLYSVYVKDTEQLEEFKKFDDNLPVTHLNDVGIAGRNYEVVIDPNDQREFEERLSFYKFNYEIKSQNLQSLLDARKNHAGSNQELDWTQYHSLETIYKWLAEMAKRHKNIIKSYVIGESFEKRPIKAIRISYKKGNKAIVLECNIHAIEWISSAAGTCFINKLLNSEDEHLRYLLMNYDWIFIPVLNPDGFAYTHNVHPLWRKNRKPTGFKNSTGTCYGTDLNRNFDDCHWGEVGYNLHVPCDHWYGGRAANTEPEVQALVEFINSFDKDYICLYLALHSYGNFVLLPYGHTTTEFPPNFDEMMRIAKGFADAAKVSHGTNFLYNSSGVLNYPVSGSAKDWAYNVKKIPFTATIELRDRGTYGFFLPADQIIPVCDELTDGLIGLIKAAEAEGICSKKPWYYE